MQPLKIIPWFQVFLIAVVGLFIFFSDFIGIILPISFTERTNVFLSFAIAMFAFLEGYSTFMPVELSKNRNLIEDARNELEKAYGHLYTLLNKHDPFGDKNRILITPEEKNKIDKIFATYPFMFPSELYTLWRDKIQKLKHGLVDSATLDITHYEIPLEFIAKINEEYDRRVKRYNKLLKK